MSSQQMRVNSVANSLELDHGLRSQTQESTRSQAAIMLRVVVSELSQIRTGGCFSRRTRARHR